MPALLIASKWVEQTRIASYVANSAWLFPTLEVVHIFGIVMLVGSTAILDLRLTGHAFRRDPVVKLAKRFLPWTWAGFGVMVVTGFLLWASEASKVYDNPAFRIKLLMIALAGLNAFIFHSFAYHSVDQWSESSVPPLAARIAGWCSILLWFGIAAAGRMVAYI